MFTSRYSDNDIATLCHAIRHAHGAGIALPRIFEMQADKGPSAMREAAARIGGRVKAGETLEDALVPEADRFPELFLTMAAVGERTGHIPEVFGQLDEYFSLQAKMRREFRAQAAWPVFQFVAAVLVIALTIYILGFIAEGNNSAAIAPVGFGLVGASGAITFLLVVTATVGGLFLAYKLMTKSMAKRAGFEAMLLRWPVLGPCLRAAAMSRFCLALRLTLDSSMPAGKAIRRSLRATGNAAFQSQADKIVKRVEKGDEIAEAIGLNPIFPREFLGILSVAEVSGQIPEVMIKQTEYYREETIRRAKALTQAMAWGVYGMVAIFIIIAIFRIANVYVGAINQAIG